MDSVKGTEIGGLSLVRPYYAFNSAPMIFFSVGLSSGSSSKCPAVPSGRLAESFDVFLQHSSSCQYLPVGFSDLSKFSLP